MLKTDSEWQEVLEKVNKVSRAFGVKLSDWQIYAMTHSLMPPLKTELGKLEELTKTTNMIKGQKRKHISSK